MSVTGTYCLWLGKDRADDGSLDRSTELLSALIDRVEWWEKPTKGTVDGCLVYYWRCAVGPYFKTQDSNPPIEWLIDQVRQEYPDLDSHYSLFVWIEGEFHRLDGCYHERNLWTRVTAVISPRPGGHSTVGVHTSHVVDMREFVERELAECG